MVIIFIPGDSNFDEEQDEEVYDESGWDVEELSFCNDKELKEKREFMEENESWPSFTTMVEIEPLEWSGFPADNIGRSMFSALRKHLEK